MQRRKRRHADDVAGPAAASLEFGGSFSAFGAVGEGDPDGFIAVIQYALSGLWEGGGSGGESHDGRGDRCCKVHLDVEFSSL